MRAMSARDTTPPNGSRRSRLPACALVALVGCAEAASPLPVCTSAGVCEETIPSTSRQHVPGAIDYPDPPPTGGDHNACWTTFGVHTTEVLDENWVHNLEHGGVVFVYSCPGGCAAEAAMLESLVAGRPFAVVSSYSVMPAGFAAVSWEHRLVTPVLDLEAFIAFYDAHVDRAPESSSANPPIGCVVAP